MGKSNYTMTATLLFLSVLFFSSYLLILFHDIINHPTLTQSIQFVFDKTQLSEKFLKTYIITLILLCSYSIKTYSLEPNPILPSLFWASIGYLILLYPANNLVHLPLYISLPLLLVGFSMALIFSIDIKRSLISRKIKMDQFNLKNETFPQKRKKENYPFGVSIPYIYKHKSKKHKSWINIPNIFSPLFIWAGVNMGKTSSIISPIMFQLIKKNFSLMIYDHKFPQMTQKTLDMHNYVKPNTQFKTICFTDMRYSNQCNLIEPHFIEDSNDINNVSDTIIKAIKKEQVNSNPFFQGSAQGILTGIIMALKKESVNNQNKICSMSHAFIMVQAKIKYILPIILDIPQALPYVTSLRDALLDGAAIETLSNQTATLQNEIKDLLSPDAYWIMARSDFSLELNKKENPIVLTIGGSMKKAQITQQLTSAYFEMASRLVNIPEETNPFSIIGDEISAIRFKNMPEYMRTARENLCGIMVGLQSKEVLFNSFGDKEARSIIGTQGTTISGRVDEQTAKQIQEKIGRSTQTRSRININSSETSVSHDTYRDYLIPVGKITNFSAGEFTGIIADEYGKWIDQSRFHGMIEIEDEINHIPSVEKFKKKHSFNTPELLEKHRSHCQTLKQIGFYNELLERLENENFRKTTGLFQWFIQKIDILEKNLYVYKNLLKTKQENDFMIRLVKKTEELLLQEMIITAKENFLSEFIEKLYDDIDQFVRREYTRITGKTIKEDIFKSN